MILNFNGLCEIPLMDKTCSKGVTLRLILRALVKRGSGKDFLQSVTERLMVVLVVGRK